jgi:hypothetical protein
MQNISCIHSISNVIVEVGEFFAAVFEIIPDSSQQAL